MRLLSTLLLAFALASCAGTREFGGDPSLTVFPAADLPAPVSTDIVSSEDAYVVGAFDKLSVSVFGVPELSLEEIQADATGRFSMPLIGTVNAGGKTIDAVSREIEARLSDGFVKDPRVAVNLKDTMGHLVSVGGQVTEPGTYPVTAQMTLLRAITRAKGLTEFAQLKDVVVFRTVNGQRMAAIYNVDAIQRGAYPDPRVYANDVIMVGDSPARRMFRSALAVAPAILSPLVYILN